MIKKFGVWLASMLATFGFGFLLSWSRNRQQKKIDKLEASHETTEVIRDAEHEFAKTIGDDADAARDWLRKRKS